MALLLLCVATWQPGEARSQTVAAASACGAVESVTDVGPYDYRANHPKLATVERFHFTTRVEKLLGGQSGAHPINDLEFIFRYFPNHHRALVSLVRLAERERSPQPSGATISVVCHFERALQFVPDDAVARMLYAQYLLKNGQAEAGLQHLAVVKRDRADDAFTQYNVGLLYFEAGQYAQALEQAHLARRLGFTRLDLQAQLSEKGHWKEPAEAAAK